MWVRFRWWNAKHPSGYSSVKAVGEHSTNVHGFFKNVVYFFAKMVNWTFLAEFIQKPLITGSLIPSSPSLAKVMIQGADLQAADVVLECGPGTGAFTGYILQGLKPHAKFAAIEINPQFAAAFRAAHPGVRLVEGSVENLCDICESMGVAGVDCVISGLPWAFFPKSMQISILDQLMLVLKPGGRFVTFEYLQSVALRGQRSFAALLPTYFSSISRSSTVWLNFPPAFVFHCRR
jgi:phosphatidylethanolamine/phosphatidyl-N-methylethanolamine N-methyltransferase